MAAGACSFAGDLRPPRYRQRMGHAQSQAAGYLMLNMIALVENLGWEKPFGKLRNLLCLCFCLLLGSSKKGKHCCAY